MSKKIFTLCSLVLLVAAPAVSRADTISSFSVNSANGGIPLSASAVFTASTGDLKIVISNTLAATLLTSSSQTISDLSFTLSNNAGTLSTDTASGQLGSISSSDIVTYVSGSPDRWLGAGGGVAPAVSGDMVTLEVLGGGSPDQLIAPDMTNGGKYTAANGGFDNFTPYAIGSVTIDLKLSGITSNTSVTGAVFSFGTLPEFSVAGRMTPEPSSLLMLGTGIIGLAGILRFRMKASDQV